ncbi:hypothetical protein LEP1GSC058_1470 [Leptospira fainei serovar Hurstbridge str. BUT 6]|uniref:Uncharacterized protein n=1 Tax=Leptospira fainei serovar Hurstbridge str. BUT 6 TaxID=1193011 RepID=S3V0J2_9LEPT|nr:hypothetical protein LEP1GSC058_1470 [Leptospira fainei serovar Hurstbridge str. BUT 6]
MKIRKMPSSSRGYSLDCRVDFVNAPNRKEAISEISLNEQA